MKLVHIYFIFKNKGTIIINFLAFFLFFPSKKGGEINADPCGFGSTALVLTNCHCATAIGSCHFFRVKTELH